MSRNAGFITLYGEWQTVTGADSPMATICDAFGSESATGYDLAAAEVEYVLAVRAALPGSVPLSGREFHGPVDDQDWTGYPTTEDGVLDLVAIVASVEVWPILERHHAPQVDLTPARQRIAAARAALAEAVEAAREVAREAADHPEARSEVELAEGLGVTRKTLRAWLGT